MTLRIELNHGAARCLVLPELGGSLGGWWIAGQAMLRPADEAAIASGDATRLSGFPLVPYSNRIADARFDWHGQSIALQANRSDEPHALHGMGWQRAWQVSEQTAASAVLRLDHPGDTFWPWPLRAEQRITLSADRLTLDLGFVHRGATAKGIAVHEGSGPEYPPDQPINRSTPLEGLPLAPEYFPLTRHLGLLREGGNVLAIEGHNAAVTSKAFTLDPILLGISGK